MMVFGFLIIILPLLSSKVEGQSPTKGCRMYGESSPSENYFYDGPPKPIGKEGVDSFLQLCSSLLPDDYVPGQPIEACCSASQVNTFHQMSGAAVDIIPNCRPCLENLYRLTCNLICSQFQANFIEVSVSPSNSSLVNGVHYALSSQFVEGFYNSCKDVKFPNSVMPVMSLLCVASESQTCTPKDLVTSIFANSDFKITFSLFKSQEEVKPPFRRAMNESSAKCSLPFRTPSVNASACSCQDCEESCPPIPDIPTRRSYKIFGVFTIFEFIVLTSFTLFALIYLPLMTFMLVRGRDSREATPVGRHRESEIEEAGDEKEHMVVRERFHALMVNALSRWGMLVANYKLLSIALSLALALILASGVFYNLRITSDPIELWSPTKSQLRTQKKYFEENFGPFYRTEQVVIKAPSLTEYSYDIGSRNLTMGPVLNEKIVVELFRLQAEITGLQADYQRSDANGLKINSKVSLTDICLKPVEPHNNNCAVFSMAQYFQNSLKNFEKKGANDLDWRFHLANCMIGPGNIDDKYFDNMSCLGEFLAPIPPNLVFAGYSNDPLNSTALVLTFIINNHIDEEGNRVAEAWEAKLLDYLRNYSHPIIEISYSTERSVKDEIDRGSHAEVKTVAISYFIMFAYVVISLGRIPSVHFTNIFVDQKIMLGFVGVLLVLLSVVSSVGLFCYLDYKVTMIVLEVLPFLTLAIGVDNIFLIVHEYNRKRSSNEDGKDVRTLVGETLGEVGHGMIVSQVAQVGAFAIGAISQIPAVRSFSLFAAVALAINFMLQMTCFLAFFTIDALRENSRRPNILCCITLRVPPEQMNKWTFTEHLFSRLSLLILNRFFRFFVVLAFVAGWFVSLYFIPSIPIGLDQTSALPHDSYLQGYFKDILSSFRSGPPVYFVVDKNFHYETLEGQLMICSRESCNNDSLTTVIHTNSRISNYSMIASPADSWLDTYLAWLKPKTTDSCCSYRNISNVNGTFKEFCPSYNGSTSGCTPCLDSKNPEAEPSPSQFGEFLPWFLSDIPTDKCPLGGKPSYGFSVVLNPKYYSREDASSSPVLTSRFMTYHTALSTSESFISAMASSFNISNTLSAKLKSQVFPYSVFYIYYDSYSTIWKDTLISMLVSFLTVFVVNLFLYGFELRMTCLMSLLVFLMILTDGGFMFITGINLNPVSLVNLVMLIGINVEFSSHIGRGYLMSKAETRIEKAKDALIHTGSSVFSGIVLTKLLGVSVLAFSKSALFRDYYFKMYACAILVGALHGLIFLPVILSFVGPIKTKFLSREALASNSSEEEET